MSMVALEPCSPWRSSSRHTFRFAGRCGDGRIGVPSRRISDVWSVMLGIVGLSFQAFVQRGLRYFRGGDQIMEGPLVEYSGRSWHCQVCADDQTVTSRAFCGTVRAGGSSLPFLIGALLTWLKIFALICRWLPRTPDIDRSGAALFCWLLGGSMVALILEPAM